MNEGQHIGDHLGDRRLFDAAQINDRPPMALSAGACALRTPRAADQDGDVAGLGPVHAAGDGAGQGGTPLRGARGQRLDFGEIVGAHFDPGAARAHGGQRLAPSPRSLAAGEGRQVIRHRSARELGRPTPSARPPRWPTSAAERCKVEDAHIEAAAGEIGREMFAQIAQVR
jgi:hypothetical protein